MKEMLECTQCDRKWQRDKVRGRKPVVCFECAALNEEQAAEQPGKVFVSAVEKVESTNCTFPPVSPWMCPTCEQTLSVHVGIEHVPIHPCRLKRNQMIALVQTTRKRIKEVAV